jgi:hypothetical protein
MEVPKRKKKRNLSEPQASLFRFPLGASLPREPRRGSDFAVAFFASFFGEAKKEVARRGQSRLVSSKNCSRCTAGDTPSLWIPAFAGMTGMMNYRKSSVVSDFNVGCVLARRQYRSIGQQHAIQNPGKTLHKNDNQNIPKKCLRFMNMPPRGNVMVSANKVCLHQHAARLSQYIVATAAIADTRLTATARKQTRRQQRFPNQHHHQPCKQSSSTRTAPS